MLAFKKKKYTLQEEYTEKKVLNFNLKCVAFLVYLHGHWKEFRNVMIYRGKAFAMFLMILHYLKRLYSYTD